MAGSSLTESSMADITTSAAGEAEAIPPPETFAVPGRARRRRWPFVFAVVVIVIAVTLVILGRWQVGYYALTPGDAQPVAPFITVPSKLDHQLSGRILLTDVYETQLTVLTYLQERYLSSDAQVYSAGELIGTSTPADQYLDQGYLQMTQAQSAATAAALTHLGYKVSSVNAGVLIYGIPSGTPASHVLKVAQVLTAVNGVATTTPCGLVTALHGLTAGSQATLSVETSTINDTGAFVPGPVVKKQITLGTPPKGITDAGCGGATTTPTAYLGIQTAQQTAWNFPVKVKVHTENIGGPSAGLAMTLGIIDKLSGGDLTGKRTVAATGTIDAQGNVGDVGGVPQKTIAVERAGATVFFVPPQEYKAALSKDTPQLKVYAVSTLDQALQILKRLGGTTPDSHVPAEAAP
jgi:PDZ domain-containing protein